MIFHHEPPRPCRVTNAMCVALQDEAHHGQRHRGLRRVARGLHQDTLHLGAGGNPPEGSHVFRVLTSSPTGKLVRSSSSLKKFWEFDYMLPMANVFLC